MKKTKMALYLLAAPTFTVILLLGVFFAKGLFPFGEKSVAWCDMLQQSIPLLEDLKDILNGNGSIFLNMNNAAGMNFYGVFFFFLSSPINLLVKFVEKENMILFANILVIIKLALCALTACIFFKFRGRGTDSGICVILSVMYALCGYGMLFYQNPMWLDVMYLFPILMLSLERLTEGKSAVMYTVTLSAVIFANYYISFMVAIFLLLFAGVYLLLEREDKNSRTVCVKLVFGTALAALITCAVWLPCLLQVKSSGRGKSVMETVMLSKFISSYETVLPLLFCTAFIFAVVGAELLSNRKRERVFNRYLMLFGLTLVPFFAEPINIMWHTGNYMSFPARYGFITVFMGLLCCAEVLKDGPRQCEKGGATRFIYTVIVLATAVFYCGWLISYVDENIADLSAYTDSLWGNRGSFDGLAFMFFVSLICYMAVYQLYRHKKIAKGCFILIMAVMVAAESAGNTLVYMTSYSDRNPTETESFKEITDAADRITDDGFYRIMTDGKVTHYNTVGALGYPSLSHYTSLTDKNYMAFQKRLGYTSIWMEVGSQGGTEFTNALYSVKYKLLKNVPTKNSVWSNDTYTIEKQPLYYGLGLVSGRDMSAFAEIPDNLTRAQVQQYIFSALYGDKRLINEYTYDGEKSSGIEKTANGYLISGGASVKYDIYVNGKQSLYADCFNVFGNVLSAEYFGAFRVYVNGVKTANGYPNTTKNGFLYLGEFENETVTVTLNSVKNVKCSSFGVFGLDKSVLETAVKSTETAGLEYRKNKIYGSFSSGGGESCVLSVPYNNGFTVKINGKRVKYGRVFSDFICFPLEKGENKIEISFTPQGFNIGAAVTAVGLLMLLLLIIFGKRIKYGEKTAELCVFAVMLAVICGFFVIYIAPILILLIKNILL